MLKLITFDIGKTIFNTTGQSKLELLEEAINIPKEKFKNDYKRIFCTSKKPLDDMLNEFCTLYGVVKKEKVKNILKSKSDAVVNPEIENLIKYFYNTGYKIATISNACIWTYNSINGTSVAQFIDKEFYSFDVGYVKPNPNIFNAVERYYGVLPNEILHIGDSKNSDYIAARKCNWNAFWFNNNILDIYPFINNLMRKENQHEDC